MKKKEKHMNTKYNKEKKWIKSGNNIIEKEFIFNFSNDVHKLFSQIGR